MVIRFAGMVDGLVAIRNLAPQLHVDLFICGLGFGIHDPDPPMYVLW